jgi:hypothetical protein
MRKKSLRGSPSTNISNLWLSKNRPRTQISWSFNYIIQKKMWMRRKLTSRGSLISSRKTRFLLHKRSIKIINWRLRTLNSLTWSRVWTVEIILITFYLLSISSPSFHLRFSKAAMVGEKISTWWCLVDFHLRTSVVSFHLICKPQLDILFHLTKDQPIAKNRLTDSFPFPLTH